MTQPIPDALRAPPAVTAQDMRRLDLWALREYHVPPLAMMENAGRALADLVLRRFAPTRADPIVALAGKGGNGGCVLAAARLLLHRGYAASGVTTEAPPRLQEETRRQLSMFRKEGGSAPLAQQAAPLPTARIVLDGLLGYGLHVAPKGAAGELVRALAAVDVTVVALDVPSGLHPDTGVPEDPTVEADATLALAFPKEGVLARGAGRYVGELYLADVAFPRPLYGDFGTTPEAIFGDDTLVRVATRG